MPNTFFGILGVLLLLSFIVAFVIGWLTRDPSVGQKRGLLGSLSAALLPSCVPMLQSDPVRANDAAVSFFFLLFPATFGALIVGMAGVYLARAIRWRK